MKTYLRQTLRKVSLNPKSVRLILLGQVAETDEKLLITVGNEPGSDDGSNKPKSKKCDVIFVLFLSLRFILNVQ